MLCENVSLLTCNNAANEYYLTAILEIIQQRCKISNVIEMCILPKNKSREMVGINTKQQLETLNELLIHSSCTKIQIESGKIVED